MVESSGLENRRTGNRTVGSNPTSSANKENDRVRIKLKYNPAAAPSGSPRPGHGEMGEWLKPAVC